MLVRYFQYMTRRLITIIVLLTTIAGSVKAQWDVQFSDYTALKSYYNPAVSGTEGKLNVNAAYSMQFLGYDNAPGTMYVGGDLPIYFLSPRHGGGVSLMSDKIGMFSTMKLAVNYSYNLKIGKKGRLALGLQASLLRESINPSDVELEDQSDPAFPTSEVNGQRVDFAAGIYYYHPKYWAGLSTHHAMAPTIVMSEKYEVSIPRSYYLMAGCNIRLKNTFITLQPSCMVMTDLTSWREDVQCKVAYEYEEKKLYFGVGYGYKTSATFMVGGVFHGVSLGYSYQMYTSGVNMINGTHELVLGYQTELDLFKKGRNLHKSVRWL